MQCWLLVGAFAFIYLSPVKAADAHWTRIESPNFEMYTTASERSAKETIRYFEQVKSFFADSMPVASEKAERVRIVAFNSMKEYEPYRLNGFAVAYYHATADHDFIVLSHAGAETFPTAIHEYTHLVVQHDKLKLPPWLNEGLAELYSTLKPMGDKILVGSLIPGRYQALLQEKWIPLDTIMNAGLDSAYYNEKDKAGSLYNEGWALTHMLVLHKDYRSKFPQVLRAIGSGKPSIETLETVYGMPLKAIESDLVRYLRGGQFQGMLLPQKLEKVGIDPQAGPANEFDVKLLLAEVGERPSNLDDTRKILQELIAQNPARPEPYLDLAYLEWQQQKTNDAREHFVKAFDLGSRNGRMLWDLGRMAESSDAGKSSEALQALLKQEPDRLDVRMELAAVQLNSQAAKAALGTLAPVKTVTAEGAPRFLRLVAYASLEVGNREKARAAANQLKTIAKSAEERDQANQILQFLDNSRPDSAVAAPVPQVHMEQYDLRPPDIGSVPGPKMAARPSFIGQFVELQCGEPAKVILQTAEGKKVLLIDDPSKLLVNGKSGETLELTCGAQKPVEVRVEYNVSTSNGIDGVIRTIRFNP